MKAIYKHACGDWKNIEVASSDVCRFMRFEISQNDSIIRKFCLLGYEDGSITLQVNFKRTPETFEYFKKQGVALEHIQKVLQSYTPHTPQELESVFTIITENGEIPSLHFETIKKIIELGPYKESFF